MTRAVGIGTILAYVLFIGGCLRERRDCHENERWDGRACIVIIDHSHDHDHDHDDHH